MSWLDALPETKRRGSLPRTLLMLHGARDTVAERLGRLVDLPDVQVTENDVWMPIGLPIQRGDGTWNVSPINEARIGLTQEFLTEPQRDEIISWWLAVPANVPNWDIASTCTIAGQQGLLLVEAKAHEAELHVEGKSLDANASDDSQANHEQIGRSIQEASDSLCRETGVEWQLSRDRCYQMSNRFAWSWKLTQLGFPVVLIYLGFLNAREMSDKGRPFSDHADWETAVHNHGRPLLPDIVWRQRWTANDLPLVPLIRAIDQPLLT